MKKYFAASELLINSDGSVFHLHIKPEQLADKVILVGDPGRVSLVASHFENIEMEVESREFKSITGSYKGKRITVVSTGTILRAIKELAEDNITYTSDAGKTYDFNAAEKLNALLVNALFAMGKLKEGGLYDVDFDHQFIETEKYDAKPTYKKFSGYRPGVAVIGDMIVGIENSDGNTNVRFHQKDTLHRFFGRLEARRIAINRFRADCGSCSEDSVNEVVRHCRLFYIRANRCSSIYDDIFALSGWKMEEINGIEYELNSILVDKWKGKAYRLVIQRQKRMDGVQDI